MPGRCISGVVGFAEQVFDVKAPGKGALFESEQPSIVQRLVTKDFDQGLVISDDYKIVTTLGEIAHLFKAPGDSQGFTFDGHIALFCKGQEL